jgi:hypothetical protein
MRSRMTGYSRVLVIPDLHAPYEHKDAFRFIKSVIDKYKPDKVIILGDEIDHHCISFHDKDPDIPFSPSSELDNAIAHLEQLYTIIPNATVLESNHGSLVYRKGKHHGLSRSVFKSYRDILQAPIGWVWEYEHFCKFSNGRIGYFHHGHTGNVLANSQKRAMNYAMGHHHSLFEIRWWNNGMKLYWAMAVGCLIDVDSLAFAYGKNSLGKPMLGCAMILDGIPKLIPMMLNKQKRWIGKII